MRKKIRLKNLVGGIALSLAVLATVPVLGATNYDWSGTASTPGSTIRAGLRYKSTSSSVIVNYSNGSSSQMAVNILVYVNGSWQDCTYYTSSHPIYVVHENRSEYIDVLNNAYEEYGRCRVAPKFTSISAGYHEGKWRPDLQ